MPARQAEVTAIQADVATFDGFRLSPLCVWSVAAEQSEDASGDFAEGNYHEQHGSIMGYAAPKIQDTTFDLSRNEGTIFHAVTGGINDNWRSIRYAAYGLLQDFSTSGQVWDWVKATPDPNIVTASIMVRRGAVPTGVTPTASNFFAYLHLNYQGMNGDYRICFVWGKTIALQYAVDGTTWVTVDNARRLGKCDAYFEAHKDGVLITINTFPEDNMICIDVGNEDKLIHAVNLYTSLPLAPLPLANPLMPDPVQNSLLPYGGSIRWTGMNGWTSFEYYPLRHQPVTLTRKNRYFGGKPDGSGNQQVNGQMGNAFVVTNGRTGLPPDQTTTGTIQQDGQNFAYQLVAQREDAGDGLGSADPPRVSDATAIIPTDWTFDLGGDSSIVTLQTEICHCSLIFDDQARVYAAQGTLQVNNYNRVNDGALGRKTLFLYGSNDGNATSFLVSRGVTGSGPVGNLYSDTDVRHLYTVPWTDFADQMTTALETELIVDGWCLWSVVRALCELGNIHPQYLATLPVYVPPNASIEAPYGPAGTDCPYYILPRGTGLNPKLKFTPEMSAWNCLQKLVQELGDPSSDNGRVIPYYMGFRYDGQFLFQPYDALAQDPVILYSDVLPGTEVGTARIHREFQVASCVDQMRTDVMGEGLNPYTNELEYEHIPAGNAVARVVGRRDAWIERNERWFGDYLDRVVTNMSVQSGIPDQILRFETDFFPGIIPSMTCWVNARAISGLYVIISIESDFGYSGEDNVCRSIVTCRNINAYN